MQRGPRKSRDIFEVTLPDGTIKKAKSGMMAIKIIRDGYIKSLTARKRGSKKQFGITFKFTKLEYTDATKAALVGILSPIDNWEYNRVPLRSGHLMDTIISTLKVIAVYAGTSLNVTIKYMIPPNRPYTIRNPKHTTPDEGWGDWGTVKIRDSTVKSKVKVKKVSSNGNALYNLNDPQAVSNWKLKLDKEIQYNLKQHFISYKNAIKIKVIA